jgi:hypothetical protein
MMLGDKDEKPQQSRVGAKSLLSGTCIGWHQGG